MNSSSILAVVTDTSDNITKQSVKTAKSSSFPSE